MTKFITPERKKQKRSNCRKDIKSNKKENNNS
jgi:hypothetical protein